MDDREHQLADRAEARREQDEQQTAQRQPVWRGDSGPMTEAESRDLAEHANRVHRRS